MKRVLVARSARVGLFVALLATGVLVSRAGAQSKGTLEQRVATLEQQVKELEKLSAKQQRELDALREAAKAEKVLVDQTNAHQSTQIRALVDQNKVHQGLIQSLVVQDKDHDARLKALEGKAGTGK